MKNVLPIMFCLLGVNAAFGQVELKGFLEGQYYQYDVLTQDDSTYFYQNENALQLSPSFAVSFYRIDRAFHEFAISNISFSRQFTDVQNNPSTTVQTSHNSTRLNFRYNYNFCILKEPKRWMPYVGLQTNHELRRTNSEQGTNQARNTFVVSQAGLVTGVQCKIKDNFRLELQMPFDIVALRYNRQNLSSSQVPNGQVRQFVDTTLVQNAFTSVPVRIGAVVRI